MKKTLFIIFLLSFNSFSQSNFKKFFKLSKPIKIWVLFHPFKAATALKISTETNRVTDSIAKTNLLDKDAVGGQVDAFRHAFWMAKLRQKIGKNAAKNLGKAHEKENKLQYKKRKLEDGVVPDKISSEMDLYNNNIGLSFTKKGEKTSIKRLIYKIVNAIKKGQLKIIKKDKKGRFLTCDGVVISTKNLHGKWKNDKCLVSSNNLSLNN